MAGVYDVHLGRIALPTLTEEFSENVGRALDTVGEAVIPGARAPVTAQLTLPIHGDEGESNPGPVGDRLRRQLRSLLNNPLATQQIYLRATTDSQLNSFIATGGGSISYNPGGPSFGEYQLQLQECYRIGTLSSHRMAKEVRTFDRTLLTTPRDYRKTYFSTSAPASPLPRHFFPIGAGDLFTENRALDPSVSTVASINGSIPYVDGLANGEGVSFEIGEGDLFKGDVVIWDRKTFTSPSTTTSGDQDPQGASGYGWEEVYGPDYALTVGDAAVIANGRCRVRYQSGADFAVEFSSGSAYSGGVTLSTGGLTTLWRSRVVSWTPDCGIIACDLSDSTTKAILYITLRRGWAGPLCELYRWNNTGVATPTLAGPTGATDSGPGWTAMMVGATTAQYLADSRVYPALAQR